MLYYDAKITIYANVFKNLLGVVRIPLIIW